MTALSIHLPQNLVKASQTAAKQLGVSRTEFIRQAIIHELQNLQVKLAQEKMAKSFVAMKQRNDYLQESQEIEETLNGILPEEKEQWWNQD